MIETTLKFRKHERGCYVADGGHYAVIADGYEPGKHIGADARWEGGKGRYGGYEGFVGGEWAAVYAAKGGLTEDPGSTNGENLDWFPTKREAVAFCESHAR